MKGETKKEIIKFVSFYIFALIILVATIGIVITLSGIYLEIINYNLDLVGIINVSLITILVLITGAYGYFTWQIVDEQRKSRQIAGIEKRLEKLYYPLMDILKNPLPNLRDDIKGLKVDSKKINAIIPFQYLVSDDLKKMLEEFIKNALVESPIDESFTKEVEADIERLKKELQPI